MIWRGKCDACGSTVTWAGENGAEPVLPNGNEKVLCLYCRCWGTSHKTDLIQIEPEEESDDAQP